MDLPNITVSNFMEKSINPQKVKEKDWIFIFF